MESMKQTIIKTGQKSKILTTVWRKFRYKFLLTPMQRALEQFYADGGEDIRYNYDIFKEDIIFDVGGYKGVWTEAFANKECKIYVFEPSKANYEIIIKKFEGKDNIKVYPYGLDKYSHQSMLSCEDLGASQYHNSGQVEEAKFVDILSFMNNENINTVKLMKLNIEGGEYDILEYLIKTGNITRFENLQIQFHDIPEINGKQRMIKIQNELQKTHELEWAYRPFIHESWKIKK